MIIQIIGAGSAGCHMARACVREGYTVRVFDIDKEAQHRFKSLYLDRYSEEFDGTFGMDDADLYVIATPPDTHLQVYNHTIGGKKVIIEKPLCLPDQVHEFEKVSVNYNHLYAPEYLELKKLPKPEQIVVHWQESFHFIMAAHPWLRFEESYLSDYKRGGGSAYEHSHGLAAALGLFPDVNREDISRLVCEKKYVDNYDSYMKMRFLCRGTLVTVITDFTASPAVKSIDLIYPEKIVRSDLGIPNTDRNDQFLFGLRGALSDNNSFEIGKLCVQLIGECHDQR